MTLSIDHRDIAVQLNTTGPELLKRLRTEGMLYSDALRRNMPRPEAAHLFDTEHHSYQVGKVARLHTMLTVRPAGITYLRALYSGDTKTAERLSVAAITPAEIAHQRIEEMKAQLQ